MSVAKGSPIRTEPTLNAPPILNRMKFDNVREAPYVAPAKPPVRLLPWLLILLLLAFAALLYQESRHHYYQSNFWHWYSGKLTYQISQGSAQSNWQAPKGPFDQRLGYSQLPQWWQTLQQANFSLTSQSQFSPALQTYTDYGFYPPYDEKTQSGLTVFGCQRDTLFKSQVPAIQFGRYSDIAPVIVSSLLFIEDRTLLTPEHVSANPVLNFPRLGAAVWSQMQRAAGMPAAAAGGSTLATQIEKYRHSPQGVTADATDKFQQLLSASSRVYQDSVDTSAARRRIAQDYINTVPLAATSAYGEVLGLADGLYAWFNANPLQVNQLLQQKAPYNAAQGMALRQVLALFIAQRRPSYYLLQGRQDLEQLVSRYLNLLQQQQVLPAALITQAQKQRLQFNTTAQPLPGITTDLKAATMVRNRLSQLLQVNFYQLDRLDLTAQTTIVTELQQRIGQHFQQLSQYDTAEQAGLFGERLLEPGQQNKVRYTFTLYQSTAGGNKVRVQTDNTDQPFDLNDASKLELGSTAKLRVLITYLEIVTELHRLYAQEDAETLKYVEIAPQDHLTGWAISYLISNSNASLSDMLQAAVERKYSADPKESFFTGGGLHTFNNFQTKEDKLTPSIAESLQQSINLPFVRLLQDIVNYSIYHGEDSSYPLLTDDDNPRRDQYLRRFADREGTTFLKRFWQKYRGKTAEQQLELFVKSARQTPDRLAAAYLYIRPEVSDSDFNQFMQLQFAQTQYQDTAWSKLFTKYQPDAFTLPDIAYLSRSHPLELWLLRYLFKNSQATLEQAVTDSAEQRQVIYQWLFKTRFRSARDNRIRSMLEIEAFWDIHQRWQRLGYPFDYLVPSLATALGSSGDRPSALAELIGIIQNDGKRMPTVRIDRLDFAVDTPYESHYARNNGNALQVIDSDIAKTVKRLLQQVVTEGTARRLNTAFADSKLTIGGKTGTGDNRIVQMNAKGQLVSSKAANRTATFVFYLGDSHFGVLTAFVPDASAEQFHFTSALPLQVMNSLAPVLTEYLAAPAACY